MFGMQLKKEGMEIQWNDVRSLLYSRRQRKKKVYV